MGACKEIHKTQWRRPHLPPKHPLNGEPPRSGLDEKEESKVKKDIYKMAFKTVPAVHEVCLYRNTVHTVNVSKCVYSANH